MTPLDTRTPARSRWRAFRRCNGAGEAATTALDRVDMSFERSEFVAIM